MTKATHRPLTGRSPSGARANRSPVRTAALLLTAGLAALALPALADGPPGGNGNRFGIETLSTPADRVSGGQVLVQITLPGQPRNRPLKISLNGQDVSAAFKPGASATRWSAW